MKRVVIITSESKHILNLTLVVDKTIRGQICLNLEHY